MAIRRKKSKAEQAEREAAGDRAPLLYDDAVRALQEGNCRKAFESFGNALSAWISGGVPTTLDHFAFRQKLIARCVVNPRISEEGDGLELDGPRVAKKGRKKPTAASVADARLARAMKLMQELAEFPGRNPLPGKDPWVCKEAVNLSYDVIESRAEALLDWKGDPKPGFNTDLAIFPDDLWEAGKASINQVARVCTRKKPREIYEETPFERPLEWDVPSDASARGREEVTWASIHPFLVEPPPSQSEPLDIKRLRRLAREGVFNSDRPDRGAVSTDVWQAYADAATRVHDRLHDGLPMPGSLSGWRRRAKRRRRARGKR